MSDIDGLRDQTIKDFGVQWKAYPENDGYYGSTELLRDIMGPFASEIDLKGANVADLGSGSGRIVMMLLGAGAGHVTAVEPSEAMDVMVTNTKDLANRISYVRARGDELPGDNAYDAIFSFGVLHHIPDPSPVVRRAYDALKPGGKVVFWLYGKEGNELYLGLTTPIRKVTTKLPHKTLETLSLVLDAPLVGYIALSKVLPLPMAAYMRGHLGKLSTEVRRVTIYDQLNPSYAKYYRKDEVHDLVANAGFKNIKLHHRHGYSWTVVAEKPEAAS